MATCGYICPKCEGKGFTDDGATCDWCMPEKKLTSKEEEQEQWIKDVHENPCCGDLGQAPKKS